MALTTVLTSTKPDTRRVGLGCMGFGAFYGDPSSSEETHKALTHAFKHGSRLWDTADCYGNSEILLGEWIKSNPNLRQDLFLASKFGYADERKEQIPGQGTGACSDLDYVPVAFKRSLERLQTPYIDLYYQHRTDPNVPIELVVQAFKPFFESGQLKYLGLSECSIETLKRAKAVPELGEKIIAVEMEFSPFTLDIEKNGFAKAAADLGVSVVAYSPLARGLISGRFRSADDFEPTDARRFLDRFSADNFGKNLALVDKFEAVGKRLGHTASQIALAWILAEHPDWVVIPGARGLDRIEENATANNIKLADEDVKEIRKLVEEADVVGGRYPAFMMHEVEGNCISLEEYKGKK